MLMSTLLNSTRWPEMLVSAFLAAVAGAIFVMAVAASLLRLLLDPHRATQQGATPAQHHHQHQQHQQQLQERGVRGVEGPGQQRLVQGAGGDSQQQQDAGGRPGVSGSAGGWSREGWDSSTAGGCVLSAASCLASFVQFWLLGGWLLTAARCCSDLLQIARAASSSTSSSSAGVEGGASASTDSTWLSFMLRLAAVRASFAKGVAPSRLDTQGLGSGAGPGSAAAAAGSAGAGGVFAAAADAPQCAAAVAASPSTSQHAAGSSGNTASAADTPAAATSSSSSITDPGSAFRRLRLLSLRRCTLSHSNNSVSTKLWQLSVLASQLAPSLGAQLVAVGLALVFWPLAVLAAISRIVATSGSFYGYTSSSGTIHSNSSGSSGGSSGSSSGGGYSYSRRSRFAVWAWGWDLLCGMLQGAANRVEGVAAGCGPVVAVASCMPELRFLDLTWLNLEPWELHAIVQMKQLHYLGLSRQQVGVVMSREAVFARNCSRSRGRQQGQHMQPHDGTAAATTTAGDSAGVRGQGGAPRGGGLGWGLSSIAGWVVAPLWYLFFWPLVTPLFMWPVKGLWGGWRSSSSRSGTRQKQKQHKQEGGNTAGGVGPGVAVSGVELLGMFEEWPHLMLIESPSGFDEAIEREFAAAA